MAFLDCGEKHYLLLINRRLENIPLLQCLDNIIYDSTTKAHKTLSKPYFSYEIIVNLAGQSYSYINSKLYILATRFVHTAMYTSFKTDLDQISTHCLWIYKQHI